MWILTETQYTLNLTEEENWVGPDGVAKAKVMLVNGKSLLCDILELSLISHRQNPRYVLVAGLPRTNVYLPLAGPTILADWGDWIEVTVNNKLDTNG